MGRAINLDEPLSDVDKEYLRKRGRSSLVLVNERRFGADGTRTPEDHEKAGAPAQSPFYNSEDAPRAHYDQGGAPLPGTILDKDTGRVFDRDNGVTVEPQTAGYQSQASDPRKYVEEGFTSTSEDGDDLDQDIVDYVLALSDDQVVGAIKHYGLKGATDEDVAEAEGPNVDIRQLNNETLAIYLQDEREAGNQVDLTFKPE